MLQTQPKRRIGTGRLVGTNPSGDVGCVIENPPLGTGARLLGGAVMHLLQHSRNHREPSRLHRRQIIEDFQTAVDLDPNFAEAWAALAHAHAFYYRLGYDLTPARGEMARQAYERAMALDPDSPEVLFGAGYYHYYIEQDLDAAFFEEGDRCHASAFVVSRIFDD